MLDMVVWNEFSGYRRVRGVHCIVLYQVPHLMVRPRSSDGARGGPMSDGGNTEWRPHQYDYGVKATMVGLCEAGLSIAVRYLSSASMVFFGGCSRS